MAVGIEMLGIGMSLVVTEEAAYAHHRQAVILHHLYLEVANHVAGEVVTRHLVEQLVFVEAVGGIGEHEIKRGIAFGTQSVGHLCGILACPVRTAALPDIAGVVLVVAEQTAFLQALHDVSCHLANLFLAVVLDDGLQQFEELGPMSGI